MGQIGGPWEIILRKCPLIAGGPLICSSNSTEIICVATIPRTPHDA